MSRTLHRAQALALLAVAALSGASVAGCAEGRPAINQVQPGALHRSVFDGEFYYQQTVIDSP